MSASQENPAAPVTGWRRDIVLFLDKRILEFTRTWLLWVSAIIGIYAGLPFAAPMLMHFGFEKAGEAIYVAYAPMCHQFVFRSWMLYGDAPAYPREVAESSLPTFETYATNEPFFTGQVEDLTLLDYDLVRAAKAFRGSAEMGWKTALCQRDIAIYAMIALAGLVYAVLLRVGVRVPYLPFWAYLILAIGPIGLDGFSQLFANPPFSGFGLPIYPIRESTPFLRTLTGAMFGLGNAWLAFPYIEESMKETQMLVLEKLARVARQEGRVTEESIV